MKLRIDAKKLLLCLCLFVLAGCQAQRTAGLVTDGNDKYFLVGQKCRVHRYSAVSLQAPNSSLVVWRASGPPVQTDRFELTNLPAGWVSTGKFPVSIGSGVSELNAQYGLPGKGDVTGRWFFDGKTLLPHTVYQRINKFDPVKPYTGGGACGAGL
jgi:hypothetical protein